MTTEKLVASLRAQLATSKSEAHEARKRCEKLGFLSKYVFISIGRIHQPNLICRC